MSVTSAPLPAGADGSARRGQGALRDCDCPPGPTPRVARMPAPLVRAPRGRPTGSARTARACISRDDARGGASGPRWPPRALDTRLGRPTFPPMTRPLFMVRPGVRPGGEGGFMPSALRARPLRPGPWSDGEVATPGGAVPTPHPRPSDVLPGGAFAPHGAARPRVRALPSSAKWGRWEGVSASRTASVFQPVGLAAGTCALVLSWP
jgi:hypothetical protein